MQKVLGYLLTLVVLALFVALIAVRPFFYDLVHMPAETMAPTVGADTYVLADKYGFGVASLAEALWRYAPPKRQPMRGDVIIFRMREQSILGRVIGVPGDKVQYYDNGTLKLNGKPVQQQEAGEDLAASIHYGLREETLEGRTWRIRLRADANEVRTSGHAQVGPDTYYVLGDSRDEAADSRQFGVVPLADVLAVVTRVDTRPGMHWPKATPSWPEVPGAAKPGEQALEGAASAR